MKQRFATLLLVFLVPAVSYASTDWGKRKVLYEGESRYQGVWVTQIGSFVELSTGRISFISSSINLNKPGWFVWEYSELMMVGAAYVDEPKRILVLGMGGGTLSMYLRRYYKDAEIINVEIDELVPGAAAKYMGFKADPKNRVVVEDGRRYLMRHDDKWDLVFLDAYLGGYIPFHLMTREFLELVKSRLSPGGAVVGNTWLNSKLYAAESATYQAVFGFFDSYVGWREKLPNRIVVVRPDRLWKGRETLRQRMEVMQAKKGFKEIDLPWLFDNAYEEKPRWKPTEPLTDDFAPVNVWRGSLNQKEILERADNPGGGGH